MIHLVNHHTWYNYSKFSARPKNLINLSGKMGIFKSKELLCWRSDLSFLNLRGSFKNCLKALHVCWTAVRNNKRIAFVGQGGSVIMQASKDAMDRLRLLASYYRESLPRFGSMAQPELKRFQSKSKSKSKSNKPKKMLKSNILFSNRKLIRFMRASLRGPTARGRHQSNSEKLVLQNRLQGKVDLASSRLSTNLYQEVDTGFFSNTDKSLKTTFNHFAKPKGKHNLAIWKRSNYPIHLSKCLTVSPYFDRENETSLDETSLALFVNKVSPSEALGETQAPTMAGFGFGFGLFAGQWFKRKAMLPRSFPLPLFKIDRFDYYKSLIEQNCVKDQQRFARNFNLKQADYIFFTNPDLMSVLAYQVKKMNIPTIGIVSGLKIFSDRRGGKFNLMDSVDYPILGNPEDSFFVLMMVRVFMNLVVKAYKYK